MADNNTVARPYAQAIFEIAEDLGELAEWSESLSIAATVRLLVVKVALATRMMSSLVTYSMRATLWNSSRQSP